MHQPWNAQMFKKNLSTIYFKSNNNKTINIINIKLVGGYLENTIRRSGDPLQSKDLITGSEIELDVSFHISRKLKRQNDFDLLLLDTLTAWFGLNAGANDEIDDKAKCSIFGHKCPTSRISTCWKSSKTNFVKLCPISFRTGATPS